MAALGDESTMLTLASVVAVLSLGSCAACVFPKMMARKQHSYVQQQDEDTGMPPQIVGAWNGDVSCDPFAIDDLGDLEHWGEEDNFDLPPDDALDGIGIGGEHELGIGDDVIGAGDFSAAGSSWNIRYSDGASAEPRGYELSSQQQSRSALD